MLSLSEVHPLMSIFTNVGEDNNEIKCSLGIQSPDSVNFSRCINI
jgi:hypothetical protein